MNDLNMSYIHCNNDISYRFSEHYRELLKAQIVEPFRDAKPNVASLYDQPDFKGINYLQKNILKRGSTDFDVPTDDEQFGFFTPRDKVLFYSADYLAMHLCSSYHIYRTCLIPQRAILECSQIVFIDYGCGPLTSGMAFWNASGQRNITYIGVDISNNMLNKAREINRNSPDGNPYFKDIYFTQNYQAVPEFLKNIEKSNPLDILYVFNFCYVLANITFIGYVGSFINVLQDAIQSSIDSKVCIINQNPVGIKSYWNELRNEVTDYPYFPSMSFAEENGTEKYKYEVLMLNRESQLINVQYNMLYNW
ncbi:hypothetical protein JT359_06875 [Candidatus Poribacteria bacterium]|nr:hypothetical protein [Candidatus Poribacteria bacterium]